MAFSLSGGAPSRCMLVSFSVGFFVRSSASLGWPACLPLIWLLSFFFFFLDLGCLSFLPAAVWFLLHFCPFPFFPCFFDLGSSFSFLACRRCGPFVGSALTPLYRGSVVSLFCVFVAFYFGLACFFVVPSFVFFPPPSFVCRLFRALLAASAVFFALGCSLSVAFLLGASLHVFLWVWFFRLCVSSGLGFVRSLPSGCSVRVFSVRRSSARCGRWRCLFAFLPPVRLVP